MKKALIGAFLLAVALAGFVASQYLAGDTQRTSPPAQPTDEGDAPASRIAFTLPDLDGRPRELAEWEGTARLVNFWATWCAPCRREIPLLKETQERHGRERLQVIGVAVDFLDDVVAYAETAAFNYPILIGQEEAMAAVESAGVDFVGLPVTMVVSAEGELLKMHMGEIHQHQIDRILDVVARLEAGKLNIADARSALGRL